MIYNIPGIKITSSRDILNDNTKLAMLLWAASGKGKTQLAGGLNKLTQKYNGKPTLYIPLEAGDGGGAATIRKLNIPLWEGIKDLNELNAGLASLANDKQFGGIVLDSSTDMVHRFVKPAALQYPSKDKGTQLATRGAGVPGRSDYQVMGELTRQVFQKLLNISAHPDPEKKKHIIVTAADRTEIDQDTQVTTWWGPELPGAMGDASVQMFQIATTIDVKSQVIDGKKTNLRYLVTEATGPKALKDRFKVLPAEIRLKRFPEDGEGLDLIDIWERYWLPAVEEAKKGGE